MSAALQHGSLRLHAECAATYDSIVEGLFGLIRQRLEGGATLKAGTPIPFGWTVLTVRELGDDSFALFEPNFEGDPHTQFRLNLDCSLDGYRRQQLIIADIGLEEWQPLRYDEDIFVERGALADERLIARRMADPQSESGWFVFRIHESVQARPELPNLEAVASQFGAMPVWHANFVYPPLFNALALPLGYTVFISKDRIEKILSSDGASWLAVAVPKDSAN